MPFLSRLLEVCPYALTDLYNIDLPMQLTGTIQKKNSGANKQVLDKLKVERERGITGTDIPCLLSMYAEAA